MIVLMKWIPIRHAANIALALLLAGCAFLVLGGRTQNLYFSGTTIAAVLILILISDTWRAAYGVWKTVIACMTTLLLAAFFLTLGVSYHWPFGQHAYTGLLGFELPGGVPWTVPVFWLFTLASSLALTQPITTRTRNPHEATFTWAFDAAVLATLMDAVLEPVFQAVGLKIFYGPSSFVGVPYQHTLGWFMVTFFLEAMLIMMFRRSTVAPVLARSLTWGAAVFLAFFMFLAVHTGQQIAFGLGMVLFFWCVWRQIRLERGTTAVQV